jgi:hypothetical protein
VIARRHDAGGVRSVALYSACGAYRYRLDRSWDAAAPRGVVVMLNPSTATEAADDPTAARCRVRLRALGFGTLTVVNLFAWRATDPRELVRASDPVGPDNDTAIAEAAAGAALVLCAWGDGGALRGRGPAVAAALARNGHRLHILGLTRAGAPRHPLYVGYAARPVPWRPGAGSVPVTGRVVTA